MEDSGAGRVYVRREVAAAIAAHARRASPHECCGLLLGTSLEVSEAVATANVAAEPGRRYQVSPVDYFALIKRCREATDSRHLEIVGVYHSHPHSAPVPSSTDHREALTDLLYIIAGPADGSVPLELRAYRLVGGSFEDVAMNGAPPDD